MIIRSAIEVELGHICELGMSSFQDPNRFDWGWTEEYLSYLLSSSTGFIHVAQNGNEKQIIGFHCGVWDYPESRIDQCRFYWLYVAPPFRGRGVGGVLIQHSLKEAKLKGKTSVVVGIWGSDKVTTKIYSAFGFEPVESLVLRRLSIK